MNIFIKHGFWGVIPVTVLTAVLAALVPSVVFLIFVPKSVFVTFILWAVGSAICLYLALIYYFYFLFWRKIYPRRSVFFVAGISFVNFLFSVFLMLLPFLIVMTFQMARESADFRAKDDAEGAMRQEVFQNKDLYIKKTHEANNLSGFPCIFYDIRNNLREISKSQFDTLPSLESHIASKAMVCYVKGYDLESHFDICYDKDERGFAKKCLPFSSLDELKK